MEERQLTEKESLEVTTSMIARTKQRYIEDGRIMLMWGYLTVALSALIWALIGFTHNPVWNWLWYLLWIIGGTLTPIMDKKNATREECQELFRHRDVAHMVYGWFQRNCRYSYLPRFFACRRC